MGRFTSYSVKDIQETRVENIRVNKAKKKISGTFRVLKYRDKDTRQMIVYIQSLQISGYGATMKKAMEMLRFSMDDLFHHFMNLPATQLEHELAKMGWKKNQIRHKEFSQAYVDIEGNLKNFNAVNDEVEDEVLSV